MTRKKSQYWGKPLNADRHPYVEFEGTPVWKAVKKAILDLDRNQDLDLTEWHQYVVGYICKRLSVAKVVTEKALSRK